MKSKTSLIVNLLYIEQNAETNPKPIFFYEIAFVSQIKTKKNQHFFLDNFVRKQQAF